MGRILEPIHVFGVVVVTDGADENRDRARCARARPARDRTRRSELGNERGRVQESNKRRGESNRDVRTYER